MEYGKESKTNTVKSYHILLNRITNLQGDIVGIVNQSGTRIVSYTYDAWGNLLNTTTSGTTNANNLANNNPLRYRGYIYDNETGLYYLQSRYYDPEVGRFLNADVYTSTGQGVLGNNMFAYCLNKPIRYIDSSGCYPLQSAFELLENWLAGDGEDQYYTEKSRITKILKKSEKMKEYVLAAIENYENGESVTYGTGEFTASEDGYELYLSTQHFSYTITVSKGTRTISFFGWSYEQVRYTYTVVVNDVYSFDAYREWESFGNVMNNLAYTYSLLGGGNDFEWYATYSETTKWTNVSKNNCSINFYIVAFGWLLHGAMGRRWPRRLDIRYWRRILYNPC